jgi:hypothetical protein
VLIVDILEADKIVPSRHGCAAGIDLGNDHIAGLVNNIGHVEVSISIPFGLTPEWSRPIEEKG